MPVLAPVEVSTNRLILRRLDPSHLPDLIDFYANPQVMRYLGEGRPRDPVETSRWLESRSSLWDEHGYGIYCFFDRVTGAFAGRGGLFMMDEMPRVEVGFAFRPEYWGRGLATEVAREIARIGFDEVGLPELWGTAWPENIASQRVLQKIGMRRLEVRPYHSVSAVHYVLRPEDCRI